MSTLVPLVVLMYHVVEPQSGDPETDPHYAISQAALQQHLAVIASLGRRACSVRSLLHASASVRASAVAFTFDDGHVSHALAAQTLAEHGAEADFFVNPALVGSGRRLSWSALRELDRAGMSIQSHGLTHDYLDGMDTSTLDQTLRQSKAMIEDALGTPCVLFAPPGGRTHPALVERAHQAGYQGLCTSRPGRWRSAGDATAGIPRLAIRAGTTAEALKAWIEGHRSTLAREQARAALLWMGKRMLGNARYEQVRALALGRRT